MSKKINIVAVLDRSGSMMNLQTEVINSFNEFVRGEKTKANKNDTLSLVLFDDHYDMVWDSIKLKDVPELTSKLYFARGMTALNDAIGKTINTFSKKKNILFLIQTDGYENASQEWTNETLKKEVKKKTEKGWKFVFTGANIDSFAEGASRGFDAINTMNFDATTNGVAETRRFYSNSLGSYRSEVNNNTKSE